MRIGISREDENEGRMDIFFVYNLSLSKGNWNILNFINFSGNKCLHKFRH